jgi:hypothetical protein
MNDKMYSVFVCKGEACRVFPFVDKRSMKNGKKGKKGDDRGYLVGGG